MIKTLYMIGGTMRIGKTTVCQQLKQDLPNSVFLDGDWCWDASPFQVTFQSSVPISPERASRPAEVNIVRFPNKIGRFE